MNVTLTDVNDNKPVFNKGSYYAAVMETASIGGDVITVKATDADAGLGMRFFFNFFQNVGQILSQRTLSKTIFHDMVTQPLGDYDDERGCISPWEK